MKYTINNHKHIYTRENPDNCDLCGLLKSTIEPSELLPTWEKDIPDAQDWLENVYGASADEAYTSEELLEAIKEYQRTVEIPLRKKLLSQRQEIREELKTVKGVFVFPDDIKEFLSLLGDKE